MMTASPTHQTAFGLRVLVLVVIMGALGFGSHLLAGGHRGSWQALLIVGVVITLISVVAARLQTAQLSWRLVTSVIAGAASQWATHAILGASERVTALSAVTHPGALGARADHGLSSLAGHGHHAPVITAGDIVLSGSAATSHHSESPMMFAAHCVAAACIAWVLTDVERSVATLRSAITAVYARVTIIVQGELPAIAPHGVFHTPWTILVTVHASSLQRRGPPLLILHRV